MFFSDEIDENEENQDEQSKMLTTKEIFLSKFKNIFFKSKIKLFLMKIEFFHKKKNHFTNNLKKIIIIIIIGKKNIQLKKMKKVY